jgi:hypothetical protein
VSWHRLKYLSIDDRPGLVDSPRDLYQQQDEVMRLPPSKVVDETIAIVWVSGRLRDSVIQSPPIHVLTWKRE